MRSEIETLKTWITESDNIVFFGGAGVSTESGIPDFRSTDGLYHQKFDYPPETILSHTFFYQHPEYFFNFYREKMLPLDDQPNEAHKKLAALEQGDVVSPLRERRREVAYRAVCAAARRQAVLVDRDPHGATIPFSSSRERARSASRRAASNAAKSAYAAGSPARKRAMSPIPPPRP